MSRPESPAAKKIAVFADVQNLYYTVRQAYGCHLNYAALWADIARGALQRTMGDGESARMPSVSFFPSRS